MYPFPGKANSGYPRNRVNQGVSPTKFLVRAHLRSEESGILPEQDPSVPVRDYATVLRRQRLPLIGFAVLGMVLGALATFRPATYASTAQILVRPVSVLAPDRFIPLDQQLSMETEVQIASSAAVARIAADRLPGRPDPSGLLSQVTVTSPPDTQILEITFSSNTAEGARDGARSFANAYLAFKRAQAEEQARRSIADIQAQMVELEGEIASVTSELGGTSGTREQELRSTRDILIGQLAVLQGRLAAISPQADPGEVIADASLPGSPSSPRRAVEVGVGLFLGLFIGLVVAFARDRMDDRIRSRAELEEATGGQVWSMPRPHRRSSPSRDLVVLGEPNSQAAERYRAIGAAVLNTSASTILVTGANPDDDAAAAAANVAAVLAQAGRSVALVATDLRSPKLHLLFRLPNEIGLADVVSDSTPLRNAVQTTEIDRLGVVTSGSAAARQGMILKRDRVQRLLDDLRTAVDIVVLEARPLLASADAHMLAPLTDGIMLAMDARRTRRPNVSRARREVDGTRARLLGVIAFNAGSWGDE